LLLELCKLKGDYENKHYRIFEKLLALVINLKPNLPFIDRQVAPFAGRRYNIDFGVKTKSKQCYTILVEYKKNVKSVGIFTKGDLIYWKEFLERRKGYPNKDGDDFGQIKGYYLSFKEMGKCCENCIAILTDGFTWIIFQFKKAHAAKINKEELIGIYKLPEQFQELKKILQNYLNQ